ncbi:hypothetical protein H4Q26_016795 [Puccinia striiformis f. sp. tritici PST-130]|nr:hypothetical protein H4Q26_016795 [Puccinia striiformis f. sp. tritici PST-130]
MNAREEEEQAKLPFTWNQTLQHLGLNIPAPPRTKAHDLVMEISKTKLKIETKKIANHKKTMFNNQNMQMGKPAFDKQKKLKLKPRNWKWTSRVQDWMILKQLPTPKVNIHP